VLLHHPFESFEPVVQFLREAVHDPDVLAIKQTIYRTGSRVVLMDLLIEAARRGKEVLAVVELKARFDEEANINWAERLEAVGAQVVYGIVGLKTHAKLLLVTRREGPAPSAAPLRPPVHRQLQPATARLYTDLGCSPPTRPDRRRRRGVPAAGQPDAAAQPPRHLLTAPFHAAPRMLRHIAQVAEAAARRPAGAHRGQDQRADRPALIEALVRPARPAPSIDLIVRGACMLPPGLPG
jgi:polyphosphate kinase